MIHAAPSACPRSTTREGQERGCGRRRHTKAGRHLGYGGDGGSGLVVLLIRWALCSTPRWWLRMRSGRVSVWSASLTIVAVGTSLPELATSAIAAHRPHSDLAAGNDVGSNVFSAFLCLGAAGLAGPGCAAAEELGGDLAALVATTGLETACSSEAS